jgi:hypothetical protein
MIKKTCDVSLYDFSSISLEDFIKIKIVSLKI